jgi:hypothetical protein
MTAPLPDEQDEQGMYRDIAKVRQRVTRLERRPGPTIPAASGGGWPTETHIMYPFMLNSSSGGISGYAYTDNFGVNRWNQYYIQATTNGAYFYRIVRLGPTGSLWGFTMTARKGSDGGQMTVSIAELSETNAFNPGTGPSPGALEDIDDVPATFFDLKRDVSPSTLTADFYAAGTTEYSEYVSPEWRFRLNGATGDPLSAVTFNTSDDINELDSGEGMYALRFKTTGQNGSSSGFRVRLHYLHLHRLTGSQLTT